MLPLSRTEAESCLGPLQPDIPVITQGGGAGGSPVSWDPHCPCLEATRSQVRATHPRGTRGPGGRCSPGHFPPQAIHKISGEF